jgi:hypothetical protein
LVFRGGGGYMGNSLKAQTNVPMRGVRAFPQGIRSNENG